MKIEIRAQEARGGTEFIAIPARLHLGGQRAEGVDRLEFELPEEWENMSVSLYVQHEDGKNMIPVLLDSSSAASVGRAITESARGLWMLAATNGAGYTAYTKPGQYDLYDTLDTSGDGTEVPQNQYEQFVSQVIASASTASNAAAQAQASQAAAANAAGQAQYNASRAEEAAARAEAVAPEDGTVLSVNGKGGVVVLTAKDVGALASPAAPVVGQMLVVESIDQETGEIQLKTVEPPANRGDGYVRMLTEIPVEERTPNTHYYLVRGEASEPQIMTTNV